jgi:hypothetical protein
MNFDFSKLKTRRHGLLISLYPTVLNGGDVGARLIEMEAKISKAKAAVRTEYERRRRCTATKPNGEPCKGWAVWNAGEQHCFAHLSDIARAAVEAARAAGPRKTPRPVCNCDAYPFPHRPGTGICLGNDDPVEIHPYPAGKRAPGKKRRRDERSAWRRLSQELARATKGEPEGEVL